MAHSNNKDNFQVVPIISSEFLDIDIKLSITREITKDQLTKNREVATSVLLELKYQLSRQTDYIKIK